MTKYDMAKQEFISKGRAVYKGHRLNDGPLDGEVNVTGPLASGTHKGIDRALNAVDTAAMWKPVQKEPDFEAACEAIGAAFGDGFDREHAIKLLEEKNLAPALRKVLAELTFEEWEDFVESYV